MKIDSTLVFKRVVVDKQPIDGEFRIVRGVGDLSGELFVCGEAIAQYESGLVVRAPIVYPYSKIERLIIELPKPKEETEE